MNAPLIWIAFPLTIAVSLWIIQRKEKITPWIAFGSCTFLALLATLLPIDRLMSFGFLSINISSTWIVLGRKFILLDSDRSLLTMLYGMGAFWMLGAVLLKPRRSFPAAGLAIIALLLSSTAVNPFFYSALIIEITVLISIPILIPVGEKISQGILRFLIFQSLAVPLILLTGWITGIVGANPADVGTLNLIILFVSLGFAFWLGIFPFYSWIPLVSIESDPFIVGFLFGMLPTMILFQAVNFINSFNWLRDSIIIFTILKTSGILMVVTGGIWAAFQKDIRRLFAFGIIYEIGFSLIGISLHNEIGLEYFILAMLPRMIVLLLWSFTLATLKSTSVSFTLDDVRGLFKRSPILAVALSVSVFSLAGLPLLSHFPLRLLLIQSIALANPTILIWIFLGVLGFFFGSFRLVYYIFNPKEFELKYSVSKISTIFMVFGIAFCFLAGIFPKALLRSVLEILTKFQYLR